MPGRALLWFAFLGGPVAWSAHLLASYPLVPVACERASTLPLNLVTLATALVAAASAAAGAWGLRRLRAAEAPGGGGGLGDAPRRARFMARFGLWSGVFFTFVILVEGLPPLLQHPCLSIG